MPFCPAALDERTLKQFVDRALDHRREQPCPTPDTWPPKRSQVQEEVARMLGFPHWHAARAAVRPAAPAPAPVVSQAAATQPASASTGLWATCPWSEGPLTFPVFEEVLAWAGQLGATDVILNPRGELALRTAGAFVTHPRPVEGGDRVEIVRHLAGGVLPRKTLALAHEVKRPSHGCRLRVLVVAPGAESPSTGWAVQCQPVALSAPAWAPSEVEPYLSHHLAHATAGLVVVASPERAGTAGVLAAIASARAQARIAASERASGSEVPSVEPSSRHLREIRQDVSEATPTGLVTRMALVSDPSTCVFGNLEAEKDWSDALRLAQSGHQVLTAMQAPGVGELLALLFRRTPAVTDRQKLIRGLNTLVAQRPIQLADGMPGMMREYLVVDAIVRQELLAASVDDVAQVAERMMDVHQSSFCWAARRAFAQGKIDPVTQDVFTPSRPAC